MSLFEGFNRNQFIKNRPIKSNPLTLQRELMELKRLMADEPFSRYYDDIPEAFRPVIEENNLDYPEDLVGELVEDSAEIIVRVKNYFDRARPFDIARDYGIDLGHIYLKSAQTPSYPSGHATQGMLLALVLGKMYPQLASKLLQVAKNMGLSRKLAKVHYESDIKAGEELGRMLFNHIKDYIDEE